MITSTKNSILIQSISILAREGYGGTSMRKVAAAVGKEPSVIYNYFADKEALLRSTRLYIIQKLDTGLRQAMISNDISTRLCQYLRYQFENRESIVALLQYFMAARKDFPKTDTGYIPDRAYEHMHCLIKDGVATGLYKSSDMLFDAKLTTHMVNGYLMEYFDRDMNDDETAKIVDRLADFIERGLGYDRIGVEA